MLSACYARAAGPWLPCPPAAAAHVALDLHELGVDQDLDPSRHQQEDEDGPACGAQWRVI